MAQDRPSSIAVLILNYKGRLHLQDCLTAVFKQDYPFFSVSVLDYGGDDSREFIRQNFPGTNIITHPVNLGTAGGFNRASRGIKSEYLFFLANDTSLRPDALSQAAQLMEDASVGTVSVKMLEFYNPAVIDQAGFKVDVFGFPAAIGRYETDRGQFAQPFEAFPTGTGLLIRTELFRRAGEFDEAFFTLSDEIDLAWRVEMMGYKNMVNPRAVLLHKVSATLKTRKRWWLRFLSERNTLRFLLKNYSLLTLFFILPAYLFILALEFIFHLVTLKVRVAFALILALLWNIYKLPSTVVKRHYIQSVRRVSDWSILKNRAKRSYKIKIFFDVIRGRARKTGSDPIFSQKVTD